MGRDAGAAAGAGRVKAGLAVDQTTGRQHIMKDGDFEWDDAKAASNRLKHGVDFFMAREVFKDIFAIEWTDHGHGAHEDRLVTVGMAENRLLCVVYTIRGGKIRIISARLTEPHERRRYHNENQT